MTLKDFYLANDSIIDYSEITVHLIPGTYVKGRVAPLDEIDFNYFLGYTVTNFRMDENHHWHLQVSRN